MKLNANEFSFQKRAAEKAASRAQDEEDMKSGKVSRAEMARINGGSIRGVRYVGPSKRIRHLSEG